MLSDLLGGARGIIQRTFQPLNCGKQDALHFGEERIGPAPDPTTILKLLHAAAHLLHQLLNDLRLIGELAGNLLELLVIGLYLVGHNAILLMRLGCTQYSGCIPLKASRARNSDLYATL